MPVQLLKILDLRFSLIVNH